MIKKPEMDAETASKIADRYISMGGQSPLATIAAKAVSPRGKRILPPPGGLKELHPRHLLVIEKMVHGVDQPNRAIPDVEPGVPLTANQTADVLNFKRRYVRRLCLEPIFIAKLTQEMNALRSAAKPRAIKKMVDLVDWKGEGGAADAKVALEASKAVLGEEAKGISINVGVHNHLGVHIKPGYVVRMPAAKQPLTIEGKATGVGE